MKDGGPVYPCKMKNPAIPRIELNHPSHIEFSGISLRDYFAGQALSGMNVLKTASTNFIVSTCYDVADAMLKERENGTKH